MEIKKIELIVRQDNSVYAECDYFELIQLRLDIVTGKIKEQLYFRNEHGGIDILDEYGCSTYHAFDGDTKLMSELIRAQMLKRSFARQRVIERGDWRTEEQKKEVWLADEYDGEPENIKQS